MKITTMKLKLYVEGQDLLQIVADLESLSETVDKIEELIDVEDYDRLTFLIGCIKENLEEQPH